MLNRKKFQELAGVRNDYCVSLYVQFTELENDRIGRDRYERTLQSAVEELIRRGMDRERALGLLSRAYELLDQDDFWAGRTGSLAVLADTEAFQYYELPYKAETFLYVGPAYYLRPLIAGLTGESRFYVLTLREEEAPMYEGTANCQLPVNTGGLLPAGLQAALQAAEGSPLVNLDRSAESMAYREEAFGNERRFREMGAYFELVDAGVRELLSKEKRPLIVAAPDHLAALYQEVNGYEGLSPVAVSVDPADADLSELHEEAWKTLRALKETRRTRVADQFDDLRAAGRVALSVTETLPAARQGQVETLFVAEGEHVWGLFDTGSGALTTHAERRPDSRDLLDQAAVLTYLHGGAVYETPVHRLPGGEGVINAVLKAPKAV